MMAQPSFAQHAATIVCSNCHRDIDIGLIADHTCDVQPSLVYHGPPYPNAGIPQIRPPPSPADSMGGPPPRTASLHLKPQRPVLPKIDSSFAWQSGQLTPSSSGHGSVLASPVSTASSRRSPSKPRKSSVVQRPPSPEMISQDCAFPPFPGMSNPKPKSTSKERGTKTRKDSGKMKFATSKTNSARSSRHSPLIHSRTPSANSAVTTASRGRSKSISAEGRQLRPTTAPEGASPAFGSLGQNDSVPPLPTFSNQPPPLFRADTAPAGPSQTPPSTSESPLARQVTFDTIMDASGSSAEQTQAAEAAAFGGQPTLLRRPSSPKEPAYKSKRPPPIASNLTLPSNSQPAKAPSPSSAKSLGRTLTEKLFGRRPSNGRRSMVRAALSDEPEPMPPPLPVSAALSTPQSVSISAKSPDSLPSANSGTPARPARPSEPLYDSDLVPTRSHSPPRIVSTEAERDREASLAALGGAGLGLSGFLPEPEYEENKSLPSTNNSGMRFNFDLGDSNSAGHDLPTVSVRRASSDKADHDEIMLESSEHKAEMHRASIDSASSYGSIGFTERTFSSRSSPPPAEESGRKKSAQEPRYDIEESSLAMPAPLRPERNDSAADSPTDPLFIDGRLSPILGNDKDTAAVTRSIDAQVVQPNEQPPVASSSDSQRDFHVDSEDGGGVVPAPLFRARKDSLASSQRPFIHKPSTPTEPLPSPPSDMQGGSGESQASFRRRKDSLASVGGRRAGTKGTCRGCLKPILALQKSVSSADGRLSGKYHKECFVCRTCREPFATAEFYVHEDQPYCAHHYHKLSDSLCATCGKGIEGLYMETANVAGRGKEKHHATCLKCATCRVQLTDDYFELSGKVYCERDAFRLAKHPRVHSRGPARPSPLVREYIRSGDPGAIRGANFPERRTNRPMLDVR